MDHASARVPRASPSSRAGDVRRGLEGRRFDTVEEIAVCDGDRLVGLVDIEDLMAADADTPVSAVQREESSLAVVDPDGRFVGLIPAHLLIEVLLAEHEEDIARLAGYARGTAPARMASEEPVLRRLRHRLPWLLVGLAGAFVALHSPVLPDRGHVGRRHTPPVTRSRSRPRVRR